MEQFVVSARKYRPQTFNDVSKAITNTLLNAIEVITLPLPYYLQVRGWKTTCARI
jgi:DNA polymerase-3 subunit gamma/tau